MNKTLIQHTLKESLQTAAEYWPALLKDLPMDEKQKMALQHHWQTLAVKFL